MTANVINVCRKFSFNGSVDVHCCKGSYDARDCVVEVVCKKEKNSCVFLQQYLIARFELARYVGSDQNQNITDQVEDQVEFGNFDEVLIYS